MNGTPRRRAVFLDRDGTIIVNKHYLKDPLQVELIADAAEAICRFNDANLAVIVVSNQSGIARGLLTEADFQAQCARLDALLQARGARIDASYHCPHLPELSGSCDCRKPGTALFARAAAEHRLDATASFFIGDRLRDVLPGSAFGGRGCLVTSPDTPPDEIESARAQGFDVAPTLTAAALAFGLQPLPER